MVRVGIIGVGNMGTNHAHNIFDGNIKNMTLAALCDISPEREKFIKENFKDVKFFKDWKEMIDSGLLDAVIIAVPHYDHPKMAVYAFEKGLNVLTEKPAGVYTKQVLEMNEAAKKSGKVFGIMYNQRTNSYYQKIKELIEKGELGGIKRIQWTVTDWYRPQAYHDSSSWRSSWKYEGGGTLINQNPHQLDLWQWMFGVPDTVYSKVSYGKYYDIEVEDDVTAFFGYKNGTTGTYITSTGEAPGTNRLEIAADMGKLVFENGKLMFYRNEVSEREFNKTNTKPFPLIDKWICEIPVTQTGEEHKGILKDFANAVENNTPLLAPGYEGIKGLTISNAIHLSSWTGKDVDLNNFPHDEFYRLLQEKIKTSKADEKKTKAQIADVNGTF